MYLGRLRLQGKIAKHTTQGQAELSVQKNQPIAVHDLGDGLQEAVAQPGILKPFIIQNPT